MQFDDILLGMKTVPGITMIVPDGDVDMQAIDNPGQLTGETESEKAAKPIITRGSRRRNITLGSRRRNSIIIRGSRRRRLELNLREHEEGRDDHEHDGVAAENPPPQSS